MSNFIALLVGIGAPLGLIWLKLAAIFVKMAKKKGISTNLALIGAFPVWALFFGLWLMSRRNISATSAEESSDEASDL